MTCLTDTEAEVLDRWVAACGTLLATGETGLYDGRGAPRCSYALESLPVSHMLLLRPQLRTYFQIAADELAFPDTRLLMLDGPDFVTEPKPGAERSLRLLPEQRFGPPELCYPELDGQHPGVLVGAHGRGHTIYLPWLPECHYQRHSLPDHRALLAQLVTRFASPIAWLESIGPVELTVQRQKGSGRLLAHIINYTGQRDNLYEDPVSLRGLRLGIRGAKGPARALVAGIDIACSSPDLEGMTWMELPDVGAFEVISIESATLCL